MQQLNWYWQALWALTSGWGALPPSLFPAFSVGFPRRLPISDGDKAALLCWRSVSAHQTHLAFIRSPLPFPLIPAWESLSDGLISCSNATFITARSILCFHYVGSAVIPWPFRNMFALNGCLEQETNMGRCTVRSEGKHRPISSLRHSFMTPYTPRVFH